MINVGIIGYGYWGPNLVRNFHESAEAQVVAVSDLRAERLALVKSRYTDITTTTDYHDLLDNARIDAIAISTPVFTHYELALAALRAGKHVLVEKPLSSASQEAAHLIEEAKQRNLVLLVDHTFVYTGAVRKVKELLDSGVLGDIYYYDSARINLGLFQHDISVIWDLAVHDLSIMDYLFQKPPYAVSATGMSHFPGEPENIAYLTLFFENNMMAHINVNWLAPVKVRRILIGGSQKMVVYDDLEPSEKIKIYDKGVTVRNEQESIYQMLISYRTGDMLAPQLDMTEALKAEITHFAQCISGKAQPITSGTVGLRVIQIMEAATQSMAENGRMVEIQYAGS
jgi:predicted dehydrogenase